MSQPKLAIVVALEREVYPLVRNWKANVRTHEGRRFKFFETENAVLVCGGIGMECARRATEATIALYGPKSVQSAGFAGALAPALNMGTVFVPGCVVDAQDGSKVEVDGGSGILVTFGAVAGSAQKAKLAEAYNAQALDMEAAAVAKAAQRHNLSFSAVKAISDDTHFEMDFTVPFIGKDGHFQFARLLAYVVPRPWLWPRLVHLARNTSLASRKLCDWLNRQIEGDLKKEVEVQALSTQGRHA